MAKLALTWRESVPPPEEKRETKVVRLLRNGDAGSWGATEACSSFVYPMSLRPLRKMAGVIADGNSGVDLDQAAEVKKPAGLDVSQLLEQVFPQAAGVSPGDGQGRHRRDAVNPTSNDIDINKDNTDIDTGTKHDISNNNDNSSTPFAGGDFMSPLDRPGGGGGRGGRGGARSSAARAKDKRGRGKGKTRTAVKPVFHAYGSANTAPPSGGVVYGGYMLSHSICPQVFPNKPRTRQVHSGTQRVAVRAAAKAREISASTSRTRGSSGTPTTTAAAAAATTRTTGAARTGNGSSSNPGTVERIGGHARRLQRKRAHGRLGEERPNSSPAGEGAGGKEVIEAVGDEDSACRGSAAIFDPVALFSALPEDIEPWGATKAGRRPQTASREDSGIEEDRDCPSGNDSPVPATTAAANDTAHASTEGRDSDRRRVAGGTDEQADYGSCLGGRSSRQQQQQQQQQQHEWTSDSHLANDPRNYKFLPRGWAGELITPAGITGPRPSSTEALIPGWTAGWTRKARRPGATSSGGCGGGGVDECGVGDCLRWSPGS